MIFLLILAIVSTYICFNYPRNFVIGALISSALFYDLWTSYKVPTLIGTQYPGDIIIAVLFFWATIQIIKYPKYFFSLSVTPVAIIIYFVINFLGLIYGSITYSLVPALGEARSMFFLTAGYFSSIYAIRSIKDVELTLRSVGMASLFLISIYVLPNLVYLISSGFSERTMSAYQALYILFSAFIILFFSKSTYLGRSQFRWLPLQYKSKQAIIIVAVLLLITLLAQHRSVWVAAAAGILLVFLMFPGFKFKAIVFYLVCLTICATVLIEFNTNLFDRLFGTGVISNLSNRAVFLEDSSADPTGQWRLQVWSIIFTERLHNIWLGDGYGDRGFFDPRYNVWREIFVHNAYVMIIWKEGIIGLVCFIFIYVKSLVLLLSNIFTKNTSHKISLISRLTFLLIISHLVYSFFYTESLLLWSLLAFVGPIIKLVEKNNKTLTHLTVWNNKRPIDYLLNT